MTNDEEFQLRVERGKRARMIREEILEISRGYIRRKYGIAISTLQSWEDANLGGMAESSAQRLSAIFKAEGIVVTPEWLMYGTGAKPIDINLPSTLSSSDKTSEENVIVQELRLFHQLNQDAVHAVVMDDALSPWLMPGDYVAGQWHFEREIEEIIDFPCIVQLASGGLLVRVVKTGDNPDTYTLACTNPNTKIKEPIMQNVKLFNAAPIIWVRKPKPAGKF